MSVTAGKLFSPLLEAATELCWKQWGAIASGAASTSAHTIIDPEALLVTSLALADREPRLGELSERFLISLPQVLSVGRTRRLLKGLSPQLTERVQAAAGLAASQGRDARWKALSGGTGLTQRSSSQHDSPMKPRYSNPAALVFRLRMGFGVGIKADALAFLLGTNNWCTIREIVDATAWNTVAVRRALVDLAIAEMIEPHEPIEWQSGRAKQYRADRIKWQDVAHLDSERPWGYHKERFELVVRLAQWIDDGNAAQKWDGLELGHWAQLWTKKYGAAFRFGPEEPRTLLRGKLEAQGKQFEQNVVKLTHWMQNEA